MKIALVNFDIDKYLSELGIKLSREFDVKFFCGHQKPKKGSGLDNSEFIDSTCLYHLEDIEKSFIGYDLEKISSLENIDYEYYSNAYLMFSRIYDRISPVPKSNTYTQNFYWKLIKTFESILEKKRLDAIIFDCTPHQPWDFAFYTVAKKLKIKTLILYRTEIVQKNLILESYNFENYNFNFDYGVKPDLEFEKIFKNNLSFLSGLNKIHRSQDITDGLEIRQYQNSNFFMILIKKYPILKFVDFLVGLFKLIEIRYIFQAFYQKLPLQEVGATERSVPNSTIAGMKSVSRFQYFFIKLNTIKKNLLIKKINSNFNNNIDIKKIEYIFYGLPYHPERTSTPEAGNVQNPFHAIKMLSEVLPENFKIIVKEHPRQLYKDVRGINYREKNFYNEISKIKKVMFVNASHNYEELIENSKMTATTNGSAIGDGLKKGKPSICFGNTWLSGCKSVKFVKSVAECKQAFQELIKQNKEKVQTNFREYIYENRNYFVSAAICQRDRERFKVDSREKNLDDLFLCIKKRIQN